MAAVVRRRRACRLSLDYLPVRSELARALARDVLTPADKEALAAGLARAAAEANLFRANLFSSAIRFFMILHAANLKFGAGGGGGGRAPGPENVRAAVPRTALRRVRGPAPGSRHSVRTAAHLHRCPAARARVLVLVVLVVVLLLVLVLVGLGLGAACME